MSENSFLQRLRAALEVTDRCPPKDVHNPNETMYTPDPLWRANTRLTNRIQLIVTGDPSRVGVVADAVDLLQHNILNSSGQQKTELRITSFMDGCLHNSEWSDQPKSAASASRQWHCYESQTQMAAAMRQGAESNVNTVIVLGSRFDENLSEVLMETRRLRETGTRIIALQVGDDSKVAEAYDAIAKQSKGVHLQLTDQSGILSAVPLIINFVSNPKTLATAALPDRHDVKKIAHTLNEYGRN